jgi:hypothetical protein
MTDRELKYTSETLILGEKLRMKRKSGGAENLRTQTGRESIEGYVIHSSCSLWHIGLLTVKG